MSLNTEQTERVDTLIDTILASRGSRHCGKEAVCRICYKKIEEKVVNAVETNTKIQFVLPAFPAKSSNRNKTLSHLPDMGERLALRQLHSLIRKIEVCYLPGAELIICSDGRVFNDVVAVSDEDVDEYRAAISDMILDENFTNITFFDLEAIWPDYSFSDMRQRLMHRYGLEIETIKKNIKEDKNEKQLFNGLHRFLFEDLSFLHARLSKNQLRLLAKEKTYQTIQRSHAWSECIKDYFPGGIRLSIHPQTCQSEKLSFQLLQGEDDWATPWHNVVLKKADTAKLVKNVEAQALGARLVMRGKNPSHYELRY